MDENSPATKKDIQELGERIAGLDEKMAGKISGLDEKMAGKISGLDEKISGLDEKISGLDEKISGLDGKIAGLDEKIGGFKDIVAELVRDAQTEILRGFDHFQTGLILRVRKAESDLSNINASTSLRLENLEERMLEIEKKLIIGNR